MTHAFALALAVLAQAPEVRPPDEAPSREQRTPAPLPTLPHPRTQQLSKEDEEVVREMALLEKLDLVKNLELFEPEPRSDAH